MKKVILKLTTLKTILLVLIVLTPAFAVGKSSMVGKIGPDFAGLSFDGYSHRLDEFKGKVIMVNFWASPIRTSLIVTKISVKATTSAPCQ